MRDASLVGTGLRAGPVAVDAGPVLRLVEGRGNPPVRDAAARFLAPAAGPLAPVLVDTLPRTFSPDALLRPVREKQRAQRRPLPVGEVLDMTGCVVDVVRRPGTMPPPDDDPTRLLALPGASRGPGAPRGAAVPPAAVPPHEAARTPRGSRKEEVR